MKYESIDELNTFEFHDAQIKNIVISRDKIIWFVSALNATTHCSQNIELLDLCIEEAEMDFLNAKIKKIEFLGYEVQDAHGNLLKKTQPKLADESEFLYIVNETLKDGWSYFQSLESIQKQDDKYSVCFCVDGNAGMYYMTIEYSSVSVLWNSYSGISWYEKPPSRKTKK
jgi:hypothetical protein